MVRADAADLRLPIRSFRVVANPPFGISSALLRRLLASGSRMTLADLVLQRAVVNRYVYGAAPGANRWARQYHAAEGLRPPARPSPRPRASTAPSSASAAA